MSSHQPARKRPHRDWKKRFYVTAATMLIANVLLLFLLAISYLRPLQAFESTKIDAQLLAEVLTANMTGQDAETVILHAKPELKLKWEHNQLSIGGVNFYRNEQGKLIRVEHWSNPKR